MAFNRSIKLGFVVAAVAAGFAGAGAVAAGLSAGAAAALAGSALAGAGPCSAAGAPAAGFAPLSFSPGAAPELFASAGTAVDLAAFPSIAFAFESFGIAPRSFFTKIDMRRLDASYGSVFTRNSWSA
jgi:hypothetical protein